MANIKKIEGKTGVSYKITVTMGRTKTGNRSAITKHLHRRRA